MMKYSIIWIYPINVEYSYSLIRIQIYLYMHPLISLTPFFWGSDTLQHLPLHDPPLVKKQIIMVQYLLLKFCDGVVWDFNLGSFNKPIYETLIGHACCSDIESHLSCLFPNFKLVKIKVYIFTFTCTLFSCGRLSRCSWHPKYKISENLIIPIPDLLFHLLWNWRQLVINR